MKASCNNLTCLL